jgi:hypothetical protein
MLIIIIIALCYVYVRAIDYYASPNALINHENWIIMGFLMVLGWKNLTLY